MPPRRCATRRSGQPRRRIRKRKTEARHEPCRMHSLLPPPLWWRVGEGGKPHARVLPLTPPPPLWGRVGEGGKPHARFLPLTPLSVSPPQGGRERKTRGSSNGAGRRRMTVLRFGLTPKMKPVSPRRAAVVAGLNIGTSKIACLIARLEPQAPQDVLRRRSHGVHILGFAHTAASGMKAGGVVDLVEVEAMVRQALDIAEIMAKVQLESVVVSLSGGRLGSERFIADTNRAGGAGTGPDWGGVLPGPSRHSVRDARAVLHSLPI